jgi:citrate synthase
MKVLFEIKEDNLETGLRGYPCGYCTTSEVDPLKGLSYVGYPIKELAFKKPEEVIYLLYKGKLGTKEEVDLFYKDLHQRAFCSKKFINQIQSLPKDIDPMTFFCTALLLLGEDIKTGSYEEDALNLIAKVPEVAALCINHCQAWPHTPSNPHLGYMENFVNMLGFDKTKVDVPHLVDVLSVFDVLHFDHDGGNLSTFVAKAVASGLENLYGSVSAGMLGLSGPRHGRANQDALLLVEEVLKNVKEDPQEGQVEAYLVEKLKNKELIYGFGHAVLRVEDPRASILYEMASKFYPKDSLVKTASIMRNEATEALMKMGKVSNPYPNVDAISGVILTAAGFPYSKYYTLLFGLSRSVGIAIQIVYERCYARNGKGTPIVRPAYFYKNRG